MFVYVFIILISQSLQNSCGVIQLFEKEMKIQKGQFILAREHLLNEYNGQLLTIFGWMRLEERVQKTMSLIKLKIKPNDEEFTYPETFLNFLQIQYVENDELQEEQIQIIVAKKKEKWDFENLKYNINLNTWFFVAIGFDYEQGEVSFYINQLVEGQFNEINMQIQVDYPDFYLRQQFNLHLGCDLQDNTQQHHDEQCYQFSTKNFNYILDYFQNLKYVYFFEKLNLPSKDFIFDNHNINKNKELISSDISQTPLKIEGYNQIKQNKQIPMIIQNGIKLQVQNVFSEQLDQEVSSPSIFMKFEYQEPLPKNFLLFKTINDKKINMKFNLVKQNNDQRMLLFQIPHLGFEYTSQYDFEEKTLYKLTISFLKIKDYFWIMISVNDIIFSSERLLLNKIILKNYQFFEEQNFEGSLKLYQLHFLNSSTPIFYKYFHKQTNMKCFQNCNLFGNIDVETEKCIDCSDSFVFNQKTQTCEEFCDYGTRNENGICMNCEDEFCSELQQKYFNISKINQNTFEIKSLDDNIDEKFINEILFEILIKNDNNFITLPIFENENKFDYSLKLVVQDPYANLQDNDIEVQLKDINVYNKQKNLISIQIAKFKKSQIQSFPLKEEFYIKLNDQWKNQKEILLIDQQKHNKKHVILANFLKDMPKYQKNMKINKPLNLNFSIKENKTNLNSAQSKNLEKIIQQQNNKIISLLKIVSFIGIFLGFFGSLMKNNGGFIFQKFIQSLLFTQLFSFLSLLENKLPKYLEQIFQSLFNIYVYPQIYFLSTLFNVKTNQQNIEILNKLKIDEDFIINFGLIFMFHFILGLTLIITNKYTKNIDLKNIQEKQWKMKMKNFIKYQSKKFFITVILMFVVEIIIFSLYSFENLNLEKSYNVISSIIAMFYIIFVVLFLLKIFNIIKQSSQIKISDSIALFEFEKNPNLFVLEGIQNEKASRYFQLFQYLYFIFASFIIIITIGKNTQIKLITMFLITLIYFIYISKFQPAQHPLWKIEQIILHFLVLFIVFLLMILFYQFQKDSNTSNEKEFLGLIIAMIILFIQFWNFFSIIFGVFINFYLHFKRKLRRQSQKSIRQNDQESSDQDDEENSSLKQAEQRSRTINDYM